jgi:hypothetical protein
MEEREGTPVPSISDHKIIGNVIRWETKLSMRRI